MTEERSAAARRLNRGSAAASGVPEKCDDPVALAEVARIVRSVEAASAPRASTADESRSSFDDARAGARGANGVPAPDGSGPEGRAA